MPQASVFIDFEGIDGSGKTTLSNRLADYLIKHGMAVHHARDQGIFRSKISRAIRDLTRDPSYLRMSDVTELLLYVARDAQMIEEFIKPKLRPGQVVFSDRYLYSAITHCHHARGLPREVVDHVVRIAAGGLWPDLVVYCDVDPLTSRIRKKIQKVRDHRSSGDFGRKGLMGIGFREEMRNGFLALARENPTTWMVIDNAHSTIEESLQRIFEKVQAILVKKGFAAVPDPNWADLARGSLRPDPAQERRRRVQALLATADAQARKDASVQTFFKEVQDLVASQPAHAALYLAGVDLAQAHQIREQIIEREPAMVAHGLRGLRSEESMEFRQRLMEVEPTYVARSLSGMSLEPRAISMRRQLAFKVPAQIALALTGNDTEEAWGLRDELRKEAPDEVLLSLKGLDTERAWEMRQKRYEKRVYLPALLASLAGIDSERAWEMRDSLAEEFMPWVLMSLRGLLSERAWAWRREYVRLAPKIIIKTIGRSDDPRAWDLRQAAKQQVKEVLDSIGGLDSGAAWDLRLSLAEKWPNTSVSSLGAGNQSERAWKFRWDHLAKNPDNLLLLKHVAKAALRSRELVGIEDAEDDDFEDLDESDFT